MYSIDSLLGWFNGKPENIPILPDPGNAGAGIKKENFKRVLVNTKTLCYFTGRINSTTE
jgi:hypothetical protein